MAFLKELTKRALETAYLTQRDKIKLEKQAEQDEDDGMPYGAYQAVQDLDSRFTEKE